MCPSTRQAPEPDPLEEGLSALLAESDPLGAALAAAGVEGGAWLARGPSGWRPLAVVGTARRPGGGEAAEGLPWRAIERLGGGARELGERALGRYPALLARGVRAGALVGRPDGEGGRRVLWLEATRRPLPPAPRRRRLAEALAVLEALAARLSAGRREREIAARARAVLAAGHDLRHELSRAALEFERLRADPRRGAAGALEALRAARRLAGSPLAGEAADVGRGGRAAVELRPLLASELAAARRAVGEARVLLSCPASLVARLDTLALQRFVRNAVQNAIRAVPRGGVVRVEARPVARGLVLAIEDEGRGMGAEEARALFDPGRSASREGLGFGTTSLLECARALGGALEVQSAPGEGTRVELRIAAVSAPHAAATVAGGAGA